MPLGISSRRRRELNSRISSPPAAKIAAWMSQN
jgi:hypothetical protein